MKTSSHVNNWYITMQFKCGMGTRLIKYEHVYPYGGMDTWIIQHVYLYGSVGAWTHPPIWQCENTNHPIWTCLPIWQCGNKSHMKTFTHMVVWQHESFEHDHPYGSVGTWVIQYEHVYQYWGMIYYIWTLPLIWQCGNTNYPTWKSSSVWLYRNMSHPIWTCLSI